MSESWKIVSGHFCWYARSPSFSRSVIRLSIAHLDGSSSSGTAFADGSTVTISSLALPTIAGVLICKGISWSQTITYYSCDASDDTILSTIGSLTNAITHDDAFSFGWRLVGGGC